MPDPNDLLGQIQMVCADVAKSKTALGYDQCLITKLGMVVFGNIEALRDAIQAPDGTSYQRAVMDEAAKRPPLEEEIEQLKASLCWAMDEIDVLSNKVSGFAYPQGMAMRGIDRESQSDNYVAAVMARRL